MSKKPKFIDYGVVGDVDEAYEYTARESRKRRLPVRFNDGRLHYEVSTPTRAEEVKAMLTNPKGKAALYWIAIILLVLAIRFAI